MRQVEIFKNYILYDDGRIYSKHVDRFLTLHPNGRGYLSVVLKNNGKPVNVRIHRLIAENFIENLYGHDEVNHKDGNKMNNHYTNLEWCTRANNIQHAYDHKLRKTPNGENNPRCKIKESIVRQICQDLLQKEKTAFIAKKYNVPWYTVDSIRKKKTWSSISDEYFDGAV